MPNLIKKSWTVSIIDVEVKKLLLDNPIFANFFLPIFIHKMQKLHHVDFYAIIYKYFCKKMQTGLYIPKTISKKMLQFNPWSKS